MTVVKTLKKILIHLGGRAISFALETICFFLSLLFSPQRSRIPLIDDQNLLTPAVKLSQQIKSGHVTAEEVVASFISRIKKVNPLINAVVDERYEQAIKEARTIDQELSDAREGRGDKSILDLPLVGVPVSVKETISVKGHSFTGGIKGRRMIKASENSDAVDTLLKARLIPIALTNIPEMAMWWDSSNPVYGRTNNPFDLSRVPGGSSGGEGALISAAGSVVGIGSDIAGSIRIPAAFCGIFGHKPTPFVVSTEGMFPKVKGDREKLLGIGPMTRYACDLKPMLKILAGKNADKLKLDEPIDLNKLKIYYVEDLGDPLAKKCNEDILKGIREAVNQLTSKYKVDAERVTLDELKYGMFLWSAESNGVPNSKNMALGYENGREVELNPISEFVKKIFHMSDHCINAIMASALEKLSPTHGTEGNRMLTSKASQLRKKFNDMLGDNGILLVPTHPEPAPKHLLTLLKVLNVSYTSVTTVLQGPITQVPLGLSKEGLPYGVQIMGVPFNDRLTLRVAEELEVGLGGWNAPCRIAV